MPIVSDSKPVLGSAPLTHDYVYPMCWKRSSMMDNEASQEIERITDYYQLPERWNVSFVTKCVHDGSVYRQIWNRSLMTSRLHSNGTDHP